MKDGCRDVRGEEGVWWLRRFSAKDERCVWWPMEDLWMDEAEGERFGRPGCCAGELEKEAMAGWASLSRFGLEDKGETDCLRCSSILSETPELGWAGL